MTHEGKIRLGEAGDHLYELTVYRDEKMLNARFSIEVEAHDRAHATRIAERAGYNVCDANMIG